MIRDDEEPTRGEPASSSRTGPAVPGLSEFDPNVRWWSNLTGFTDPLDDGEVQSLLSPETSRTLIANLQDLDAEERARVTTSLLAFVGLFIAELMKVVNDAQYGDKVLLLQVWIGQGEEELSSLVQRNVATGPGNFAKLLTDLQAKFETKGKREAALVAKKLGGRLQTVGVGASRRATDRRDRLQALLVVYDQEDLPYEEQDTAEFDTIWDDMCPFLVESQVGGINGTARSTSSAAGALDSDDDREGILVRRAPEEGWKPATKEEAEELRQHDQQVREEAEAQAHADEETFRSLLASRAREWEDWAMFTELHNTGTPRKRARAMVTLATKQGTTLDQRTLEGVVPPMEEVMVQVTIQEDYEGNNNRDAEEDAEEGAPSTPATVRITDTQVGRQLLEAGMMRLQTVDLDTFMNSKEGTSLYKLWTEGGIGGEEISRRWGKDVMELFQVTRTIEEDSQALDTQKDEKDAQKRLESTVREERGSSSEPGMEGLGPEERRAKRVREGGISGAVGYVAPMDEENLAGEVQVETEQEPTAEHGVHDDMDVQELDDCELIQTEMKVHLDNEETIFMQQQHQPSFDEVIHGLLSELESMTRPKAARTAGFLRQLLRDQQRMAPHLRNPVLRERAESLQALVSVFTEDDTQLRGDEQDWCMQHWQRLLPLLEGRVMTASEPARPAPSTSLEEAIEVVDSQEQHVENGSRKQVVMQSNGTQRNLTQDEEELIAENEEAEAFAAELLREEDERRQDVFTSVELREWEAWAARNSRIEPGAKRARVQVTVQGEGGRIVKQEDWLVGVKEGEYLAYSVSVHQYANDEDTPDPQAASSGGPTAGTRGSEEGHDDVAETDVGRFEAGSVGTLPVTGETAPAMWDEADRSSIKDFSVDDFMETPLAAKFFRAWAQGQVSDRLIGQRFGYGVLGRFYGRRDWHLRRS